MPATQAPDPKYLDHLVKRWFSAPERTLVLSPSQPLFSQGEANDRLYYLHSGRLEGYVTDESGSQVRVHTAGAGDFVGLHSFFSGHNRVTFAVEAVSVSRLLWFSRKDLSRKDLESGELEKDFMPLVVAEMSRRFSQVLQLSLEREKDHETLREVERMTALGQLAAGVAHELNNALAVVERGGEWLKNVICRRIARFDPRSERMFLLGLENGRAGPGEKKRECASRLRKEGGADFALSRLLSDTGLPCEELKEMIKLSEQNRESMMEAWELGATLRDLGVSSKQAHHVVESMKQLGAPKRDRNEKILISSVISTACNLLQTVLRSVEVDTQVEEGLHVRACEGELVQVFTNLIRNSCDAMISSPEQKGVPKIVIRATRTESFIRVDVADNGPGIPAGLAERIFEPSFTTKKGGLSFGLGLGLTIVRKLAQDNGGSVEPLTVPEGACFRVVLPLAKES